MPQKLINLFPGSSPLVGIGLTAKDNVVENFRCGIATVQTKLIGEARPVFGHLPMVLSSRSAGPSFTSAIAQIAGNGMMRTS